LGVALTAGLLLLEACAIGDVQLTRVGGEDTGADIEDRDVAAPTDPDPDPDSDSDIGPTPGSDAGEEPDATDATDGSAEPDPAPDASVEGDPDAGQDQDQDEAPRFEFCERYGTPIETAKLQDDRLRGVSGVVASHRNAGILWVHNDFPDVPTVYAVEAATGITRGVLRAPTGLVALNLEDIALARCPDAEEDMAESVDPQARCLWLADSGNNDQTRTDLSIFVLPEPVLSESGGAAAEPETWTADRVWHFPFSYPDGNHDSEAFMVEPDGSALYLLEKLDASPARLFEAKGPFEDGMPLVLERIGELAAQTIGIPPFDLTPTLGRMMTGADLHPSRTRFVMRSYIGSYEYRLTQDDWALELPSVKPVIVALGPLSEPQGEAIAYDASGKALWTISEDPNQRPGQGIHHYPCLDESSVP
jgi:hypothetical protein